MSLFQSGNPTLTQKMFDRTRTEAGDFNGTMTVRGTMNKFGFLMLMLIGGAAYTWQVYYSHNPSLFMILFMVGAFGSLGITLLLAFKPKFSTYLAPIVGVLEGFFVGALSAVVNANMSERMPKASNLVVTAVLLTMGIAMAMFLLYNFGVIKPTQRFKSIVATATFGVAIFYLLRLGLSFFGVQMEFMNFGNSSTFGIGISIFLVVLASLNLIMDFERIEEGANNNLPKFMEWYCGMGLMITLVWLYVEVLRLLSRFSSRD